MSTGGTRRLLVVDDNLDAAESMTALLEVQRLLASDRVQ